MNTASTDKPANTTSKAIIGPPAIIPTDLTPQQIPCVLPSCSFGHMSRIKPSVAVSPKAPPVAIKKPAIKKIIIGLPRLIIPGIPSMIHPNPAMRTGPIIHGFLLPKFLIPYLSVKIPKNIFIAHGIIIMVAILVISLTLITAIKFNSK